MVFYYPPRRRLVRRATLFGRDILVTSVVLGTAGAVSNSFGFTGGNAAINSFGTFLPVYGTVAGAGLVLDGLGGLSYGRPRYRYFRRRR